MPEILRENEGVVEEYPPAPSGLSTEAKAIVPAIIWERLENWIAHRFAVRSVSWVAGGAGEWTPPLTPATITTVEAWDGSEWSAVTLDPSPCGGYMLPVLGVFRFTGTVGGDPDDDLPATITEAYRRIAEYLAAAAGVNVPAGAASYEVDFGPIKENIQINPAFMARAMVNSGAADLLRQYRRT